MQNSMESDNNPFSKLLIQIKSFIFCKTLLITKTKAAVRQRRIIL